MLESPYISTFKGDELKEVAGSVFVDGSLEFCAPEVRIISVKMNEKHTKGYTYNLKTDLPVIKQFHSFCLFQFGMTTLSEVDAILLSNHNTMLALPYVTEYSGFKGTVYCTEPTQQIGRYMHLILINML